MFRDLAVVLFMLATATSLPLVADQKKQLQMLEMVIEDALGALIDLAGSERRVKKEDHVEAYEHGGEIKEESDAESKEDSEQLGKVTAANIAQIFLYSFKLWNQKMPKVARRKVIEKLARKTEFRSLVYDVNKVIRIMNKNEQNEDERKYLIEELSLHSNKALDKIQEIVDRIAKELETEIGITTGPLKEQLQAKMAEIEKLGKKVTKANIVQVSSFIFRRFSHYTPEEFSKANMMLRLEKKFPEFKSAVNKLIRIMTKEKPNEAELRYLVDELSLHSKMVLKETQGEVDKEVARYQTEMTGMKKLLEAGKVTKENVAQIFSYIFKLFYEQVPDFAKESVIKKLAKMGHGMEVVNEVIRIMTEKAPSEKDVKYLVDIYSLDSDEMLQGIQQAVDLYVKGLKSVLKDLKAILNP